MTRWTADRMPDLTGRTVVITGGGRGIGLVVTRELARAGAHVVLAVRSVEKARRALTGAGGDLEFRQLDVSDLDSVRTFAQSYTGPVDGLINTAGVAHIPAARTAHSPSSPGKDTARPAFRWRSISPATVLRG